MPLYFLKILNAVNVIAAYGEICLVIDAEMMVIADARGARKPITSRTLWLL